MNTKINNGFTLIELVITIAIVGILASIAYPSYTEQVQKSRRADCSVELVLFANALERFATARGTYAGAGANYPTECLVSGGMGAAAGPGPAVGTPAYEFSAVLAASTFTLRAVPRGPQVSDKCGTLTLTNTGVQGIDGAAAGLTPQDCW